MIETTVRNFIGGLLSVDVYLDVPADHPESYVVLERVGGGETNHVRNAQFAVQSYAPSMYGAAALNELAKLAMNRLVELDAVGSSALETDYNFTDTTKKEYRYQAIYNIVYCTEE